MMEVSHDVIPFLWLILTRSRYLFLDPDRRRGDGELAHRLQCDQPNQNNVVRQINYALFRLTEPVLGPIRRLMPDLGGLDISPVIALHIGLQFIRYLVVHY